MTVTIGIIAIIEDELREEVLRLWGIAETRYNSKGVQSFGYPNLGFQGGQCEDIIALKKGISDWCSSILPFEIIVDGFGYFQQPSNVIYLKVIKTEELKRLHKDLNDLLIQYCSSTFQLYIPQNWIPHITVAMDDLTDENLQHFKRDLAGQHPSFKQKVSSIQLVKFCENGNIELVENFICRGIN